MYSIHCSTAATLTQIRDFRAPGMGRSVASSSGTDDVGPFRMWRTWTHLGGGGAR